MKQVHVRFKNWELVAWIGAQDSEVMVAVRPIAEAIGVQSARQLQRIQADPRFNWTHMCSVAEDGKQREMLCLPVKQLSGWLYGINANKVKPELKEKLIQFQEDCQMAIHDAISGKVTPEIVARLEAKVDELHQIILNQQTIIERQQTMIEGQQQAIHDIQNQQQWSDYRYEMEASHHGRSLRSLRKDVRPPLRAVTSVVN